jgi:predicted nucleotidyltransferase
VTATLEPALVVALCDMRSRLEAALPGRVAELKVFGSVARGEATPESDLDVLVLLREPASEEERSLARVLVGRVGLDRGLPAVAVVISTGEWAEMKRRELLFVEEVERDGIEA